MKKKKNIIKVIIITITFSVILYFTPKTNYRVYDDFIFFTFLSKINFISNQNNPSINQKNTKEYKFDVTYKDLELQEIDLKDTIKQESLINGKLAPGVSGIFKIIIMSNLESKYKIEFIDINKKPQNLKFEINKVKYNFLTEINNKINGKIKANENKTIEIKWLWNYESDEDKIDSQDGISISDYRFQIRVIGEEGE